MNIIFIGGLIPPEQRKEVLTNNKAPLQEAGNILQYSFLKGLDHFYIVNVISATPVGQYPLSYSKIKIRRSIFSHNGFSKDVSIGYPTIPFIDRIFKIFNIKKEAKGFLNMNKTDNKTYLIVYSLYSPFLKAAVKIKKSRPNVKICLIVPDLPQYMSDNKKYIYRILKRIDRFIINKLLLQIDSFVLLTDYMKDELNIGNRPWVRIEGIADYNTNIKTNKENFKIILYTGSLSKRYGIFNLLDAFSLIESNDYRLWICGDGNIKDEIVKRSLVDQRISYFGQIPYSEVLNLQQKATILINPRTSEGEYTKFSFPSKTIDYLASGTPCILHRLKGIPTEYYPYAYFVDNETPNGLKDAIIDLCSKPQQELDKIGERAVLFIKKNKTPVNQVGKMLKILN